MKISICNIQYSIFIPLLLTGLIMFGCTSETPPLPDEGQSPPLAKKEIKPEETLKPLEKAAVEDGGLDNGGDVKEVLFYNPEGRRDPFLPFTAKITDRGEKKPLTPLQKFDVHQFKLVAIIWGVDNPIAMVEDPEGRGRTIKRGTQIGNRGGKVINVLKDKVIIEESFQDALGKLKTEEVILELPKEEEISIE